MSKTTETTKIEQGQHGIKSGDDLRSWIETQEAEHGGAWTYAIDFGTAYVTRAPVPSKIPDHLRADSGDRIRFRGQWQNFTPAAVAREAQRGYGSD